MAKALTVQLLGLEESQIGNSATGRKEIINLIFPLW